MWAVRKNASVVRTLFDLFIRSYLLFAPSTSPLDCNPPTDLPPVHLLFPPVELAVYLFLSPSFPAIFSLHPFVSFVLSASTFWCLFSLHLFSFFLPSSSLFFTSLLAPDLLSLDSSVSFLSYLLSSQCATSFPLFPLSSSFHFPPPLSSFFHPPQHKSLINQSFLL